jgi:hypothetical protein
MLDATEYLSDNDEKFQKAVFDYTWNKIKRQLYNELILFNVPVEVEGKKVPQDLRVDMLRFVKHKFKDSKLICLWSVNDKQNYIYNVLPENYKFKTDSLNTLSTSAFFAILPKETNHNRFNGVSGKVDFNYINALLT